MNIIETQLSKRFETGLKKLGLGEKDLETNWTYIGGETGQHLQYFKKHYPLCELPEHQTHCICGHRIRHNCFISNNEGLVLAVGGSCVNRFCKVKKKKQCIDCGAEHRNRKDNVCKICRRRFTMADKEVTISFK